MDSCRLKHYSFFKAMTWGNFSEHAAKVGQPGLLGNRIVHLLIAALEILPVFGQFVSLMEYGIAACLPLTERNVTQIVADTSRGRVHAVKSATVALTRKEFNEQRELKNLHNKIKDWFSTYVPNTDPEINSQIETLSTDDLRKIQTAVTLIREAIDGKQDIRRSIVNNKYESTNEYIKVLSLDFFNISPKTIILELPKESANQLPKPFTDFNLWKQFVHKGIIKNILSAYNSDGFEDNKMTLIYGPYGNTSSYPKAVEVLPVSTPATHSELNTLFRDLLRWSKTSNSEKDVNLLIKDDDLRKVHAVLNSIRDTIVYCLNNRVPVYNQYIEIGIDSEDSSPFLETLVIKYNVSQNKSFTQSPFNDFELWKGYLAERIRRMLTAYNTEGFKGDTMTLTRISPS